MTDSQTASLKTVRDRVTQPGNSAAARDRIGKRKFIRAALQCMSEEEQPTLLGVLESARTGNVEAKDTLCEMLEDKVKAPVNETLKKKGVACQDWDSGRHDLIVLVRERIEQLCAPEKFFAWLFPVLQDVARRLRPHYVRLSTQAQERPEDPKQIGRKWISVAGQLRRVDLIAPYPQELIEDRQPVLEPLSDSVIMGWSKGNRPNYSTSIDVWRAMASLPERWARAMFLMHVEERTAAEAGEILGCAEERVYRIIQRAKERLRDLLKAYATNTTAESVLHSYRSRQAAILKRTIPSDLPPRRCWVVIQLRMVSANPLPVFKSN